MTSINWALFLWWYWSLNKLPLIASTFFQSEEMSCSKRNDWQLQGGRWKLELNNLFFCDAVEGCWDNSQCTSPLSPSSGSGCNNKPQIFLPFLFCHSQKGCIYPFFTWCFINHHFSIVYTPIDLSVKTNFEKVAGCKATRENDTTTTHWVDKTYGEKIMRESWCICCHGMHEDHLLS